MAEFSAERFAQRALELGLLDARQMEFVRNDLGPESTVEEFRSVVLRKELLTNFQVERLLKGDRSGYFYGNYKVLYLAGSGTFARVYRAVHRETDKVFAVKVLRKRFRHDAMQMELFLREGELGLLLRHPNIVPTYEIDTDPNAPFFVMDFVEGQNLREWIKIRKKLDLQTCMRLIIDIVSALVYAAQQGIFHRDLKLSNVLVTSRGRARLVDFGLYGTRAGEDASDIPSARTVDYVGLERATGVRKNDPRSDIYFSGCILYHMLSGVPPLFETRDRIQRLSVGRFRDIRSLAEVDSSVPRSVVAVVQKAMELAPEKRYQTPAEFLADLQTTNSRLLSGEDRPPDSAEVGGKREASGLNRPVEIDANARTVMVVVPKVELQNVLREKLKKYGYRVLVFGDPSRALARFDDDGTPADCILIGTTGLEEAAVDAFNRMLMNQKTANLPAVLLIDEDHTALESRVKLAPHRVIVRMPLRVKELLEKLQQLMPKQPSTT
jgi:serine/threonine-protein kinase